MTIALVKGSKYWAGANRPWIVSRGMVTGYLEGKGFGNVVWHDREEPLPTTVNPRSDRAYDDDWDEWVSADYQGPTGSLNPPAQVSWLVAHLPSIVSQQAATASVPSWVTASQQAGYAAAQAAKQAAAAAQASAMANSGLSSGAAAPAASTPEATPSAPRDSHGARAGAAVATLGVLFVLGTVVNAILRGKRR